SDPVDKTVRLPLFVTQNKTLEPHRVVIMTQRRPSDERYVCVKPTLNEGGRPVAAAGTLVTYIRDATFTRSYYQAGFTFDKNGVVVSKGRPNAGSAVPITDPLVVPWTPQDDTSYFRRADYLSFTAAEREAQFQSNVPAVRGSTAVRRGGVNGRTILLDPGHG